MTLEEHAPTIDVCADPPRTAPSASPAPTRVTAPAVASTLPAVQRGLRVKRLLDLLLSGFMILLFLPIMIVVAAAVLIADGRPILYSHDRLGRNRRTFRMHKFRTMVVDADSMEEYLVPPGAKPQFDPRVTRLGRFLRKTSLDELPQMFDVFRGSMSLVGPRPILPQQLGTLPSELARRFEVPQGVTGLWQIKGRADISIHSQYVDEVQQEVVQITNYLRYDLEYLDRRNLLFDIGIILRTPVALVAYLIHRDPDHVPVMPDGDLQPGDRPTAA
jgi:lipopolysaccharide/colanic/teichoic acid biosynthesis glycosyltransferase